MWVERSSAAKAGRRRRASASASAALGLNGAPGNGPKPVMRTRIFLEPEYLGDFFRRARWRQATGGDVGFELRQRGFERAVGAQRREQPLLQHRPHPLHLLGAAPRRKLTRGGELLPMVQDMGPQRLNAVASE